MATLINPQQTKAALQGILTEALEVVVRDLANAFQNLIEANIYDWPNTTQRQNGSTVSSPRNIVDTGEFKRSQRLERPNPHIFQFVWDAQYAAYIYYGYRTLGGQTLPGRDWITPALDDLRQNFAREVARRV